MDIMGEINTSMNGLGQEIQRLEKQSEQIQNIVGVITALQTKPIFWLSMPPLKRPGQESRAGALPLLQVKCGILRKSLPKQPRRFPL